MVQRLEEGADMFESFGEIVVLVLAVIVVWMVAWGVAERRTAVAVAAGYEAEAARARRIIFDLERRLSPDGETGWRGDRHGVGEDDDLDAVTIVDPPYAAIA